VPTRYAKRSSRLPLSTYDAWLTALPIPKTSWREKWDMSQLQKTCPRRRPTMRRPTTSESTLMAPTSLFGAITGRSSTPHTRPSTHQSSRDDRGRPREGRAKHQGKINRVQWLSRLVVDLRSVPGTGAAGRTFEQGKLNYMNGIRVRYCCRRSPGWDPTCPRATQTPRFFSNTGRSD
jgi:hypothetical protein